MDARVSSLKNALEAAIEDGDTPLARDLVRLHGLGRPERLEVAFLLAQPAPARHCAAGHGTAARVVFDRFDCGRLEP